MSYQVGREPGIGPARLTCPKTDTDHSDQSVPVLFAPLFLEGRVFGNLPPEDSAQNRARAGASAQPIVMATSELLISVFSFTNRRRLYGGPEGLVWTARGPTCRKEWRRGSGAVPAG
jgi:hypothetical protein